MLQQQLAKLSKGHSPMEEYEEVKEETDDVGWTDAEWDEWHRQQKWEQWGGVKHESEDGTPGPHHGVEDVAWRDRSSSNDTAGGDANWGSTWKWKSPKQEGWYHHSNKQSWVKQEWWQKPRKAAWAYDRSGSSSKPSHGQYVKGGFEADGVFYPYL